jgi:hypothetical protein
MTDSFTRKPRERDEAKKAAAEHWRDAYTFPTPSKIAVVIADLHARGRDKFGAEDWAKLTAEPATPPATAPVARRAPKGEPEAA